MKKRVLILKGLCASGKSTFAKDLLKKESSEWKRVNKDDIRLMLDNSFHSKINEKFVIKVEDNIIYESLKNGFSVIVDDCNLNPFHVKRIDDLVSDFNAEYFEDVIVEIKEFNTPIEECIERDKNREKSVGEKVIRDMAKQYLTPITKKDLTGNEIQETPVKPFDDKLPFCILCDIDGTLSNNWKKVDEDKVNPAVYQILRHMEKDYKIILVSGRDSVCLFETKEWLIKWSVPYYSMHMRHEGDTGSL